MLPEQIKSKLRTYYQANYVTYLAQVEANHANDPITLENFQAHIFCNARVFQVNRQFPYCEFADTVSRGEGMAQQSATAGPWGTIIEIRKKFRAPEQDLEKLAKVINRHQEAFLLMLKADPRLGGALPLGLAEPPEFRTIESNEPFFQGLLIRLRVKHKV